MVKQEVVIIVDKSGSMYGKEADTIGGINTMINTLKESLSKNVNGNENKKGKRKRRESGIERDSESIRLSIKFFDHEEFIQHTQITTTAVTCILLLLLWSRLL